MSKIKFNTPISQNESGVLAQIWRKILLENNYDKALDVLVQRYVDRADRAKEKDATLKMKNKSTLITNITAPEMTFKTFLDLLFNLLTVRSVTMTVKLTFHNGSERLTTIRIEPTVADDGGHDEHSQNNTLNPKHDSNHNDTDFGTTKDSPGTRTD